MFWYLTPVLCALFSSNLSFLKWFGKLGIVVNNDCTKFEQFWFINKKVLVLSQAFQHIFGIFNFKKDGLLCRVGMAVFLIFKPVLSTLHNHNNTLKIVCLCCIYCFWFKNTFLIKLQTTQLATYSGNPNTSIPQN